MKSKRHERAERLSRRREVLNAVAAWWEAWIGGDLSAVDSAACERYVELSGNGEPRILGKTALLDWARNADEPMEITEWSVVKPEVRAFEDAAVCSYCFEARGTRAGRGFSLGGRARDVLVKVDGRWRIVAQHGSFTTSLKPARPRPDRAMESEPLTCVSLAGDGVCPLGPSGAEPVAGTTKRPGCDEGEPPGGGRKTPGGHRPDAATSAPSG